MKKTYNKTNTENNLVGQNAHRNFIEIQAAYGFAQRGGVTFISAGEKHQQRLVSDINLLNANEKRKVVFSEAIFSN